MRVKTPLGEIYVDQRGSGPDIVLWHSFLHHGGMWKAQVEALQSRYRVINVDAPGHGRSSVLGRAATMDDCADVMVRIFDALSIERATLCGLSWGGMVSMRFALSHASRVQGLVLCDTSCRAESRYKKIKYDVLGSAFRKLGAAPMLLRPVEPLMFCDATLQGDRAIVDDWAMHVVRMHPDSVWNALQCISLRRDLTSDLARVRVPTLVMVGAEDRAQPVAESEAIARAIPGAKLEVIPSAGHLSALERPREFNERLLKFVDSNLT